MPSRSRSLLHTQAPPAADRKCVQSNEMTMTTMGHERFRPMTRVRSLSSSEDEWERSWESKDSASSVFLSRSMSLSEHRLDLNMLCDFRSCNRRRGFSIRLQRWKSRTAVSVPSTPIFYMRAAIIKQMATAVMRSNAGRELEGRAVGRLGISTESFPNHLAGPKSSLTWASLSSLPIPLTKYKCSKVWFKGLPNGSGPDFGCHKPPGAQVAGTQ
jgi:hypothetical protein